LFARPKASRIRRLQEGLPARQSARDAVASVQIDPRLPVIPVRALKNAGTEEFTAKQREVAAQCSTRQGRHGAAQLEIEHYWAGALRRAVIDGDVENGSLMAGQSVGMVTREEPVADILAELVAQAEANSTHSPLVKVLPQSRQGVPRRQMPLRALDSR
jgi:NAD(P)H-dependent flavin oxidoreductase YrpB (nitropropane dioxygenase family)